MSTHVSALIRNTRHRTLTVFAAGVAMTAAALASPLSAHAATGPIPAVPSPAGHWSFDEGTGTTAADSSGNGHAATLGATAGWGAGNVGSHALALTGTATGEATVTGPAVDTSQSFTASAWVNLKALGGFQTVLSISGTNVSGFYLGLRGDTGTLAFARLGSDATGTATVVASPTAPVAGTWYHIVGVDDVSAGTLTLYVDGHSIGSTPVHRPVEGVRQHTHRSRLLRRQPGRLRQRLDR